MTRADYFRRQADICLRLSLIATDQEVAARLIVMAQNYRAKADAEVAQHDAKVPPPEMTAAEAARSERGS